MQRQKMVALRLEQYNQLNSLKQKTEQQLGTKFDWGAFLIGAFAGGVITSIIMDIIEERKTKQKQEKKKGQSKEVKK